MNTPPRVHPHPPISKTIALVIATGRVSEMWLKIQLTKMIDRWEKMPKKNPSDVTLTTASTWTTMELADPSPLPLPKGVRR